MTSKIHFGQLLALAALIIAYAPASNAYVDPNSAGLLYQIAFPLLVLATTAWRQIRNAVSMAAAWVKRRHL